METKIFIVNISLFKKRKKNKLDKLCSLIVTEKTF